MKRWLRFAWIPLLGALSMSALAAPGLTPQECGSYPFVQPAHGVTHAQLMREVRELADIGYDVHVVGNDYPADLEAAEQRLATEYRRDCLPQQAAKPGASTPAPATGSTED